MSLKKEDKQSKQSATTPNLAGLAGAQEFESQTPYKKLSVVCEDKFEKDLDAPHRETLGTRVTSNARWLCGEVASICHRRVPMLHWLPTYNFKEDLLSDIIGGATIGMVCLAQTLAHAAIATTKPIQGPYCAFVPAIAYAVFGTSAHASVSSGAIAAIIIADALKPWADIDDRTELASLLALVSGAVLIISGFFNLAFAVRFLSQPTISGFITGGSLLIVTQQLKNLFGFHDFPHTDHFVDLCRTMVKYILDAKADWVSFSLGVIMMVILDCFNRLKDRAKKAAKTKPPPAWAAYAKRFAEMKEIVVTVFGATCGYLIFPHYNLACVGKIPAGLPPFKLPWEIRTFNGLVNDSEKLRAFVIDGVLVSFTTFLTTYATTKKMALVHGYQLDAGQEMVALGSAGTAGAFFGAFPPSGSLSRTGLAADCGVKTQLGGIFCAVIIGLGLTFLTPALEFLPKCTLAAIIITSTKNLIDFETPRKLLKRWKSRRAGGMKRDLGIWCLAFFFTTFMGVLQGIGAAVVVSILLIVADAAAPQTVVVGLEKSLGNKWRNVEEWQTAKTFPGIMCWEFRGPLSFASAEWFQEQIEQARAKWDAIFMEKYDMKVKFVIMDLQSVHNLDSTALSVLEDVLVEWKKQGVTCIIASAKARVRVLIEEELGMRAKLLQQTDCMMSMEEAVSLAQTKIRAQRKGTIRREVQEAAALRIERFFRKIHAKPAPEDDPEQSRVIRTKSLPW